MKREIHTIDASGKILGRLAVQIALLLRGKNKKGFTPHIDNGDIVKVINAKGIKLTGKKTEQKEYFHYTGYMSGLRAIPFKTLMEKKPTEALRKAVYRMLPGNKLRDRMIRRLKFEK